ncbi:MULTISPECIES: carbonic anhydrase [Pedobacter]|uniref:Carbonic anhydrase 2 n=1 Tax=Pedobacter heparinus (strain ATCC 13125 / DSM 2366 / CIP 104194 / JCM 7457 / NBRC 12017 / NCIMB 9290 / NRRL B-14731 / HIM 762-3) TaxID=485917 RepID=C6Y189_PEDHD|nr:MULTISPECIES: carbonic anhydrase [Pedobacter]ACU02865.1 Carbonate dehydratase [Pedobacter heparinus DSM 2366]MBB5438254.1 carbonic anhydrase [Pedobacter sp. AK017]
MCAKLEKLESHQITYESLLKGNKEWVAETLKEDPKFFEKLSAGQAPPVLWIGCSDSRVPANQITNTMPGDIFVHRNIANVVTHTDMNLLSVLDYSVNVLKVKHIIVCGHYGCGGVNAALGDNQVGLIDNWLRNIKDVIRLHEREMQTIKDPQKKSNRLVELNAIEGAANVMSTSIVQNAWATGQELSVHAWVYSLQTGLITDLQVSASNADDISPVFKMKTGK